jgi:cytidyltransferase-like protein
MDSNIIKLERRPWIATDPRDKIRTVEELVAITQRLHQSGKVVVQAHGTFDLLHLGHVRHLEAARALGDTLVVTVTADEFVSPDGETSQAKSEVFICQVVREMESDAA